MKDKPAKPNNDSVLRAYRGEHCSRTPVWFFRQAGRYLPEYRALRAQQKDFLRFVKNPVAASEATLQPLRRFSLDAAIVFADILTIPDAMGYTPSFQTGVGPVFSQRIDSLDKVRALTMPQAANSYDYLAETIDRVLTGLANDVPLLGFSGAPWTLACYLINGGPGGRDDFREVRKALYQDKEMVHALLQYLTQAIIDYLLWQIKAGVHAVVLFDTWAGQLSPALFAEVAFPYTQQIWQALQQHVSSKQIPQVLFTRCSSAHLPTLGQTQAQVLAVDWTVNMDSACKQLPAHLAVQGNMEPAVLYGTQQQITSQVHNIIGQVDKQRGYVFNLGHGVWPDIDPLHVQYMIDAVHSKELVHE